RCERGGPLADRLFHERFHTGNGSLLASAIRVTVTVTHSDRVPTLLGLGLWLLDLHPRFVVFHLAWAEDLDNLGAVQRLTLQQGRDERVEFVTVNPVQLDRGSLRVLDDLPNSRIDLLCRRIGEGLVLRDLTTKEDMLLTGTEIDRTDSVAHTPEPDHTPCEAGGLLEVVLCAGRDLVEDNDLGRASAQHAHQASEQVLAAVEPAIFFRHLDRDTAGGA